MKSYNISCCVICLLLLLSGLLHGTEYTVPESWQLLAQSQEDEIADIAVQGKWVAWLERRLDPKTAGHRARSYFVGLYRKHIDSSEIETLRAPERSRTKGEHFVLGANGIVSYDYRHRSEQTLYVPGESKAFLFPQVFRGRGEDTPVRIYNNALLCHITHGIETGISIIPFDGNEPDLKRKIVVFEPGSVNKISYRGDYFWNGKYLLYTRGSSPRNFGTLGLFDIANGKKVWGVERKGFYTIQALGLSREYAYYFVEPTRVKQGKAILIRRSTKQDAKPEELMLPLPASYLIDFFPERLLSVLKDDDQYFIAEIDFTSGSLAKFDLSLPNPLDVWHNWSFPSTVHVLKGSEKKKLLSFTGDAESGQIIVLLGNKIYAVPKAKPKEVQRLMWNPTGPEHSEDHRSD